MLDIDKYDLALAFFLVGPFGIIIFLVAMCRAAARGDRDLAEQARREPMQEREARLTLQPDRTVTVTYMDRPHA